MQRNELAILWGLSVVIVAAALVGGYWFPRRPGCDEPSDPLSPAESIFMLLAAPIIVYVVLPVIAPASTVRLWPHAKAAAGRFVAKLRRRDGRRPEV